MNAQDFGLDSASIETNPGSHQLITIDKNLDTACDHLRLIYHHDI